MLEEVISAMRIQEKGIYLDATFGRGGHSTRILAEIDKQSLLIAMDRDLEAINYAKTNFTDNRLKIFHANFKNIKDVLNKLDLYGKIDAILLDLGISSPQIDCANRGFSFNKDGPLDMRMDKTQTLTAQKWLEESSEKDIADTLYQLGEEKKSKIIAFKIKQYQKTKKIRTTLELAKIICNYLNKDPNKFIKFIKDRPYNDKRYSVSTDKIRKLGWKPENKLINDLPEIINWYKKNMKLYKNFKF